MAVLESDSPLHKHVHRYKHAALCELSKRELRLGRKVLGSPRTTARKNGVPLYTIHTPRLAKLLRSENGVTTWNNILKAYRGHAGICVVEMEGKIDRIHKTHPFRDKRERIPIVELNLANLDLSDVLIRGVSFVRCDLRGSDFSKARMGELCDTVVFDCCDLAKACLDGIELRPYQIGEDWVYRFSPDDKLVPVCRESWGEFQHELESFAFTKYERRVEETTTKIDEEVKTTPSNPF